MELTGQPLTRTQLACVTSKGFALLEGNSTLKYINQPLPKSHMPHIRFNDGACDSKGRFFAGTIYSKDKGIPGQLWRYDPADGSCVVVDEGPFTVCLLMHHLVITHRELAGLQWPGLEPGRENAVASLFFSRLPIMLLTYATGISRTHWQTLYMRMTTMTEIYPTGGCSPTRGRKVYLTRLLLMACASIVKAVYGAHG